MERYGTVRQTTGGNILRRMRIACWISKDKKRTLIKFNKYCSPTAKMGYVNAIQYYDIRTLPALCTLYTQLVLRSGSDDSRDDLSRSVSRIKNRRRFPPPRDRPSWAVSLGGSSLRAFSRGRVRAVTSS